MINHRRVRELKIERKYFVIFSRNLSNVGLMAKTAASRI
jgi:hypothetical protein